MYNMKKPAYILTAGEFTYFQFLSESLANQESSCKGNNCI